MKVDMNLIQGVADIFTASKKRRDKEYADFLEFYKKMVETSSSDIAKVIGNTCTVHVGGDGKEDRNWGLYLTIACYLEWKAAIANGLRFTKMTIEQVQTSMVLALAKVAESNKLTTEERKALLELLDKA